MAHGGRDTVLARPSRTLRPLARRIDAKVKWNLTGFRVTPGEPVTIEVASDNCQWTCNPGHGWYGGEGKQGVSAKRGYALPGAPEGALVARVGSHVQYIGTRGRVALTTNQAAGMLELTCNDDLEGRYGAGYTDNRGYLNVVIW